MAILDLRVPLAGRVALITGSTSGMGREAARHLALNGATVVLHGFGDAVEIEAQRAGLAAESGQAVAYLPHDLADPHAAAALVDEVISHFGKLDILINNAGIQHVDDIDSFPTDKWDELIAVNLTAAFHTIRRAFPGMRERRWGRIINTASTLGLTAELRKPAYVAAKHGIIGLTREVALEGAEVGVTCNAICPGWVLTPLVSRQVDAKVAALGLPRDAVIRDHFLRDLPTRRFVETNEIAGAMLFLCSEVARSITGCSLPVDGGSLVI